MICAFSLPPDDSIILNKIIEAANFYKNVCDKDYLYVSLSKNINNVYMFKCNYIPAYFQHLCGVKSQTMNSNSFYYKCINNPESLAISDCTPSQNHTMTDIYKKSDSLIELLSPENLRAARLGKKISGFGNVDFEFAIGNGSFLGYKYDSSMKKYYPLTNMIAPIASYCINPQRLSLVLSKRFDKEKYDTVEYEAKKDLLKVMDENIFKALSEFLDEELVNIREPDKDELMLE